MEENWIFQDTKTGYATEHEIKEYKKNTDKYISLQ